MSEHTENVSSDASMPEPTESQISGSHLIGQTSLHVNELREAPEEREHRLREEEADARLKRWKEKILFISAIAFSAIVSGICIWVALSPSSSSDASAWARNILTLIIGGFVGFLTGKATK
jgi:hypothetical protein